MGVEVEPPDEATTRSTSPSRMLTPIYEVRDMVWLITKAHSDQTTAEEAGLEGRLEKMLAPSK